MKKSRLISMLMVMIMLVSLIIPSGIATEGEKTKPAAEPAAKAEMTAAVKSVSAAVGETAKLKVTVENAAGELTFQWYESEDGKKFVKSAEKGNKTKTLSVKVAESTFSKYYRCKVKDGKTTVNTKAVQIKNSKAKEAEEEKAKLAVKITQSAKTAKVGKTVTFKAKASGNKGTTTYAWQSSTDGGKTWKTVKKKASFSVKVTNTVYRTLYRCQVKAKNGKVTSKSVYVDPVNLKDFTFKKSGKTWAVTAYKGKAAKVTVPSGRHGIAVTSIGKAAFKKKTKITSVVIPKTVTSIGVSAFEGCSKLASVTLSDSVTQIGKAAFKNCRKLTTMKIVNK